MAKQTESSRDDEGGAPAPAPAPKSNKKKLLLAIPVLLVAIGAGGWFSGIIPDMLYGKKDTRSDKNAGAQISTEAPIYTDIPEILTNLNVASKRASYAKLHIKVELSSKADEILVQQAMPRIMDMFQTYIRDLRPEELKGSIGSYRLREELINRVSIAAAPAHINDILFIELVVE